MYVNAKIKLVETVPGKGAVKESGGGVEFKSDIFDTLQEPL
jgi:hypothetical protein